jgi:hypothetical protein
MAEENKGEGLLEEQPEQVVVEQGPTEATAPTEEQSKEVKGKAAPKKSKAKNGKKENEAAPKKTKREVKAIPKKTREELLKVKINEDEVVKDLKAGMDTWEVACKHFNYQFDHADRTCWIFYQKINTIKKKNNIDNGALKVSPQVKVAISNYLQHNSEKDLFSLLTQNTKRK